MKKLILKMKIGMTNIRRVLVSLLFINISINKIFGITVIEPNIDTVMCYAAGPPKTNNAIDYTEIFILLVPVLIVIGIIVFVIKKIRKDDKEDE